MSENVIELESRLNSSLNSAERLNILMELATQYANDDFVESWKYAQEAVSLAEVGKDREMEAKAHETLAQSLRKLAEYSDALEHFENALDNFLGLGDLYAVARCYCGMGIVYGSLEEYRTALECFEEGLSASRRANRPSLAATLTGNIGHVYFNMGRYQDALDCFQHSYDFYKEKDNSQGAGNMIGGMAGIYVFQGEYSKGLEFVRRAYQLHRKAKDQQGIAVSQMNIGLTYLKMGDIERAEAELNKALNYARSVSYKVIEYDTLKHLSQVYSELDKPEKSRECLQLYLEGSQEEKKLEVQRKKEQMHKRQSIRFSPS